MDFSSYTTAYTIVIGCLYEDDLQLCDIRAKYVGCIVTFLE